jgi:hypothetical protein
MSFDAQGLDPTGAGRKGSPKFPTYVSATDALATILADAYFDTYASVLQTGDVIYIKGSDGECRAQVTSASGDVSLAVISTDMNQHDKSSEDTDLDYGFNVLSDITNQAYSLPTPAKGLEVMANLATASTGSTIVDGSTAYTIGASGGTVTLVQGDTVRFRAVSSTRWEIVANQGEAVLS